MAGFSAMNQPKFLKLAKRLHTKRLAESNRELSRLVCTVLQNASGGCHIEHYTQFPYPRG